MPLLYSNLLPASVRTAFTNKVESIAAYLEIDPNWLMQVMKAESGLKPGAHNMQGKGSSRHLVAAGLIQFTLGSGIVRAGIVPSLQHILTMGAVEQLDLVKWYFHSYKGKMNSYYDVYAVTFFPYMIGKPDNWVLQTKGLSAGKIAAQNKGIARGKSHITVADFKRYAVGLVPRSVRDIVFGNVKQAVQDAVAEVEEGAAVTNHYVHEHPVKAAGISTLTLAVIAGISFTYFRTRQTT